MNFKLKRFILFFILCFVSGLSFAQSWNTSLASAMSKSERENKCILIVRETPYSKMDSFFDSKEFKDFAKDNLILVKMEFVYNRAKSDYVAKSSSNQKLIEKLGFPEYFYCMMMNKDGSKMEKVYSSSGTRNERLNMIRKCCIKLGFDVK